MGYRKEEIPKITVGRYAGTRIDQLPNGYLRWMITQDFPKLWLDIAKRKLDSSPYNNDAIAVSRHCIDQYSLRFIEKWIEYSGTHRDVGLGTFVAQQSDMAWKTGLDVSKHRHQNDGVQKELDGIVWVFGQNVNFPEYIDVITCFPV